MTVRANRWGGARPLPPGRRPRRHCTIPRSETQSVVGPGIQELMNPVAAQGIAPASPWFNRHFNMNPATFDFEIGVPVAQPVTAAGRVRPSELPVVIAHAP